ncbi:hypothetical protein LTSEADE_0273, partial [Salmonella enterica subsp. enterica serovar Adelaide str. A4-669]
FYARPAVVEQACALLSQHRHTILRTSRRAEDRQLIDALCEKSAMSRQQLGERLSQRLGVVTLNIIEQARIGGLFLTGGDIATIAPSVNNSAIPPSPARLALKVIAFRARWRPVFPVERL